MWGEGQPAQFVDADGERSLPIRRGAYEQFYVYARVRDWLVDGAEPPVDPRDSIAVLGLIEAARRSARTATIVELNQDIG